MLNFICAEINYGGRVTDYNDKRLIAEIMHTYLNPEMMQDGHQLSESGIYVSPEAGMQADYLNYIERLPLLASPEVFGMHDNAEITNSQSQTVNLLKTVLSIQPRASSKGGKSREAIIQEIATLIESKMPKSFDLHDVKSRYQTKYEESMNTVLVQEVEKFNTLIGIINVSLYDVKRALNGFITMNDDLEKIATSLYSQQVPVSWGDIFLSEKALTPWVAELQERVAFFKRWVDKGKPSVFWFSAFCFPQAFLTGTLQNFARKAKVSIDRIEFDFKFLDDKKVEDISEAPESGIYIYGLFIEGAKWNYEEHRIGRPVPKELFSGMPVLWMIPKIDRVPPESGIYKCPVYKVTSREGSLSTTGHSTNFVRYVEIPSGKEQSEWVKAGVACFLSLRT